MQQAKKKDILLTVGLSQRSIERDGKVDYQVSYCYQIVDMQAGDVFQSEPALARGKNYLNVKLSILIEVLSKYGSNFNTGTGITYVHYAALDDRISEIWNNVIFDGKEYATEYKVEYSHLWEKVIELCQQNNIVLNIVERGSVLSALSKAQGNILRRRLEEGDR